MGALRTYVVDVTTRYEVRTDQDVSSAVALAVVAEALGEAGAVVKNQGVSSVHVTREEY